MKKVILFIALCVSTVVFGQAKIKDKKIFSATFGQENMYMRVFDDGSNNLDTTFVFLCQDSRYTRIIELVKIAEGSASNVCSFLTSMINFIDDIKNESGVTSTVAGRIVSTTKFMGMFAVYINAVDNRGNHSFTRGSLETAKNKLIKYCNENKIPINCNEEPQVEPAKTEKQTSDQPTQKTSESKFDKLRELKKLLDDGTLTQEEFDKEKSKILETE